MRVTSACEVCGNTDLEPVLDLGLHPLCDDLVREGEEHNCERHAIRILFCANCCTAHQQHQVPKRLLFPESYHYRSRFTADVLSGMDDLAHSCEQRLGGLDGRLVLDIGCNDGSLLDAFLARGARTAGIEPTGAARDASTRHAVIHDYFGEHSAAAVLERFGVPDVITFTNVFAHIEDLQGLLQALRVVAGQQTLLVIENHYLGAVLARNQFDTFYHEHPRTYSARSFVHIAAALGLAVQEIEFPARYGGNIRVFLGHRQSESSRSEEHLAATLAAEAGFGDALRALPRRVTHWQQKTITLLDGLVAQHGPLRAKAFPGRAAILLTLLGVDADRIATVHEKPGSMKIGHYVPGTRIPIRSDDELLQWPHPPVLINLAWHIGGEIRSYLLEKGYRGEVIDILSDEGD
jgi:SAM-dependent methyltransferase